MVKTTADHLSQRYEPSTQSTAWASLVSTPLVHSNRFDVLATTDDEHQYENWIMSCHHAIKNRVNLFLIA